MSSGTCQQFGENAVKTSDVFGFRLSRGSVVTYCREGGNLFEAYIEIFLTNQVLKEF